MRKISIAARISKKTAIDEEDIIYVRNKLKEMSQADFIRTCINTQRKFDEGKLISISNLSNNNQEILDAIKEQFIELKNKGYLAIDSSGNEDKKAGRQKVKKTSKEMEKEDKKNNTTKDQELEQWSKNPDFMELLDGINDE